VTRIAADLRPNLPALRSDVWEPTKTTLHPWVQIVGKVKLATTAQPLVERAPVPGRATYDPDSVRRPRHP
jgi:hypothetical protein